ncbi:MAG TPA: plastocyanin/azurin family copper-binding protein [Gaiellaceae bacterium]
MKLRVLVLSLFVAAVGLTIAPIAAPLTKATTSTTVTVTIGKPTEFHFLLSKTTVPHGTVVFKLVNKGKIAHDFSISGKTSKKIGPGKSGSLTVALTKGKKPYKCTVDAHAAAGMKGVLKVT